jgi:uncharacterized protein (DUF488 family)
MKEYIEQMEAHMDCGGTVGAPAIRNLIDQIKRADRLRAAIVYCFEAAVFAGLVAVILAYVIVFSA